MEPFQPSLTAFNADAEPWRLQRLARVDGRVRELMRMLTEEGLASETSVGEAVWARGVRRLHDDRGELVIEVSATLADSPWLTLVAATAARAWLSEDETAIRLRLPDGGSLRLPDILPRPVFEDLADTRLEMTVQRTA